MQYNNNKQMPIINVSMICYLPCMLSPAELLYLPRIHLNFHLVELFICLSNMRCGSNLISLLCNYLPYSPDVSDDRLLIPAAVVWLYFDRYLTNTFSVLTYGLFPVNTRRWANVVSVLLHRLRRWTNIVTTLVQFLVFTGINGGMLTL